MLITSTAEHALLAKPSFFACTLPPPKMEKAAKRQRREKPAGCINKEQIARRYAVWLEARGAWWAKEAVRMEYTEATGWGVVALCGSGQGTVLFRVPRSACFGVQDCAVGTLSDEETTQDSQARLACLHMAERAKGAASMWAPRLDMFDSDPAANPFTWPAEQQAWLDGTDLEAVLCVKRARLEQELANAECTLKSAEYRTACAIVASHVNPWFGGSMCPFNELLNYNDNPSVVFQVDPECEAAIIGVATRDIMAGDQVTTYYCAAVSEFVYKYGFVPCKPVVPLADDVVNVSVADLVRACRGDGERGPQRPKERVSAMQAAQLLEQNGWDGVDELSVELGPGATGTAQLVAACLSLQADAALWAAGLEQAGCTLDHHSGNGSEGEGEGDPSDAAAAALCACFCAAHDAESLAATAAENGAGDQDPWPALLLALRLPGATVAAAMAAASRVIEERLAKLADTPIPATAPNGDPRAAAAWEMAMAVRDVESAILERAAGAVTALADLR